MFSKDEIVHLLRAAVPPRRVEDLAAKRGIDFQVAPECETDLPQAGADNGLLVTFRVLAPNENDQAPVREASPSFIVRPTPGGVEVYADDEAQGTTSSEGKLKIMTLTSGRHNIRLSLKEYEDYEQTVEPSAGQTFELDSALQRKHSPARTVAKATAEGSEPLVYRRCGHDSDAWYSLGLLKTQPAFVSEPHRGGIAVEK